MKVKYRGVIFDLDGTLVDTIEDIAVSMNRALKLRGFPEIPAEAYKEKVGSGVRNIAFLSLPADARDEETVIQVAADSARFYAEIPMAFSRPYPGIPELISELGRKKIKMAVLSNKPDPVTQKVMAGLFPPGAFICVQGEISGKPRKPDPSSVWEMLVGMDLAPSDVIFAGDSDTDMKTAISAGCFPLGVSWGYRSRETILEAGARRIIEAPEELLDFFK